MSSGTPTGDFFCAICGAPGGHGGLQCPQMAPTNPYFTPAQVETSVRELCRRLDRVIDLMGRILIALDRPL